MNRPLTEDEGIQLLEIKNSFYIELSKLIAQHLAKAPIELENILLEDLQDYCSVYGSCYDEYIVQYRNEINSEKTK
jgi:hypothetical protein